MNAKQKRNAFLVLDALAKTSICSPEFRIGILCVLMKESGMIPKRETGYANTSNDRIRKVFGRKKLREYYDDDDALKQLKRNPQAFFNHVYAYLYGNGGPKSGDGWRNRGGGLNQLTFAKNYKLYQELTGWALVRKPGLIRYIECASDVSAAFFDQQIKKHGQKILDAIVGYHICYTSESENVFAAAWINAGIGKKPDSSAVQRAYKKALKYLPAMTELYYEWENKRRQKNI
jgi:predicted chitinase